jgi:hypothetical protein
VGGRRLTDFLFLNLIEIGFRVKEFLQVWSVSKLLKLGSLDACICKLLKEFIQDNI